jgi:hypothetical protein
VHSAQKPDGNLFMRGIRHKRVPVVTNTFTDYVTRPLAGEEE